MTNNEHNPELHPNFALACVQLLYWSFFKPITLGAYTGTLIPDVEANFPLGRVRSQIWNNHRLRRLLLLQYTTTFIMPWLIIGLVLSVFTMVGGEIDLLESVYGIASGIVAGVLLGILASMLIGIGVGVISSVIGGLAGAIIFSGVVATFETTIQMAINIYGIDVAIGPAVGVTFGITIGLLLGIAAGPATKLVGGVPGGLGGVLLLGLTSAIAFGGMGGLVGYPIGSIVFSTKVALPGALAGGTLGGIAGGTSFVISYLQLLSVWFELPLHLWLVFLSRLYPANALKYLDHSPVFWDEGVWSRLPFLDNLLRRACAQNREGGLARIEQVVQSFRQGWAANRALAWVTADTLKAATTSTTLVENVAQVKWLPDDLTPLGRDMHEIYPGLQAVGNNVATALGTDNIYSSRLTFQEALDQLDTLDSRVKKLGRLAINRWGPVIDQWHKVIASELVNLTTPTDEIITENPYQPGNPLQLTRKELFKGRQKLRDTIINALLERNRPTLVIHGPRRMGKTTFLLQLPGLLPGNTLPIFFDLQRPVNTQSTSALLYHLSRAISRQVRSRRLILDPPQRSAFDVAPFEAFAEWLEDVALPSLQNFNLLLTFDEFEKLAEAVETGRLDEQIFDEMRHLIQHQTRLALLFVGVQTLDELGPAWSSYFINVKPLTIGYLKPAEAEELIRQPDPSAGFRLTYDDNVVTQIMIQTHCQPYLMQLVCSAIVEECNAQATLQVDQSIFDKALVRALEQGEPYFRNVWDEMAGPDGQPLLYQIAEKGEVSLPDSPALARLTRRRVVTRLDGDGKYQVEIPIVCRWIIEQSP